MSGSFDRLPIRSRLAGVSALLTFVILCAFAVAIGSLTVHRIRADFNRQVADTARQLPSQLVITAEPFKIDPPLSDFASTANHSVIRILSIGERMLAQAPAKAPALGRPRLGEQTVGGYRVISVPAVVRLSNGEPIGRVILQYGRRVSDTEDTVKRVELFLLLGVLAGTALALLAGMAIARRAMAPIAELTTAAAEIARTRDPSRRLPQSAADDEVAELARTLDGMLRELDAARAETESALARQRQFVADASHELRTPLTSVLANLELLAESLGGDEGDAARSALRSSQRMRRLVADLLLLARTDVGRVVPREPVDLARVVVEAAGELGPVSTQHEISLDVHPAIVEAAHDELHRLTINLLENALRHTPPGTEINVSTATSADGQVQLVVEDNGPGVPPELASTLFERFVRGSGDRGGSFGLGLAIVHAVAVSHGGSVQLEQRSGGKGARFVVRLPAYSDLDDDGKHHRPPLQSVVD
ncbi:MAG: two-component system, OmpR family, sensor kinase [Solirubrobacteraceae bacterium]|jgi:signal transduction histidine kinase|nr:two-component system, OmpR family, sensor kinase [Solirubrobacteraceae bacterium]